MAVPTGPVPDPAANRTDLNVPSTIPTGPGQPNGQPVRVPTGLPYGENQQLQQAQQQVPLPQQPQPGAAPGGGGGAPLNIGAAMTAAKNMTPPKGGFSRPTERPHEPVTAGLPGSPVQPPPPRQTGNLSSMIAAVAHATNSAALSQLAARAAGAGQ